MENGIKKLQKYRNTIFLSEIGALIHDLGKLNDFFVEKQSIEGEKDARLQNYHHGKILEYDSNEERKDFYPDDKALKHKAETLKNLLENRNVEYNGESSYLYSFIKDHHCTDDKNRNEGEEGKKKEKECPNDFVRLLHAADGFDAAEDRSNVSDNQSTGKTYYSNAFGYEKEIEVDYKAERKVVYDYILDILDTCDINVIKSKRKAFLDNLKNSFSKALGMTARAANDVSLWEHAYMTASIMKALLCQSILENTSPIVEDKEDIEKKNPFKIYSIGWDFFELVSQSHKIPDVVGRIKVLEDIKKELKNLIEAEFLLGNGIYEDDYGIHFLVPAAFNEERIIEDKVFEIFNEKTNGVLIPHLNLTGVGGKLTELLPGAIGALEREIRRKSINDFVPKWTSEWKDGLPRKKLICRVCGKGFYCEGEEEICDPCKGIRNKGRERKSSRTIFIDEVAWSGKEYENVALVVLNFDLSDWLKEKFVRSLFVQDPNQYKKEIFDLYEYLHYESDKPDFDGIYSLIRNIAPLAEQYIKNQSQGIKTGLINMIKQLMQKDTQKIIYLIGRISKKKKLGISINKFKSVLGLQPNDLNDDFLDELIPEFIKINQNIQLDGEIFLSGNEANRITELIFGRANLKIPRGICKKSKNVPEEFWKLIVQKTPSPSRLMRVWNNTKDFFDDLSTYVSERSRVIEQCVLILKIDKSLDVDRRAWEVEISAEGKKEKGEVVFDGGNCRTVTPHINEFIEAKRAAQLKIEVTDRDWKVDGNVFYAEFKEKRNVRGYRTISVSPNLFMFLVPASKVFDSLLAIKSRYIERFGKVYGKLPLNMGLVYFKRKMPFFVVLDSARRYIDCFKVQKEPIMKEIKEIAGNEISTDSGIIALPYKLGDGEIDYYHPYIMVEEEGIELSDITVKHILSLEKGDKIKIHPSSFDFQFLDTNTRRFDIVLNKETKKRRHDIVGKEGPRPYLLEDLEKFCRLKNIFEATGSWTPIRDIGALTASKRQEWCEEGVFDDEEDVYEELIDSALENRISDLVEKKLGNWKENKKFLKQRIIDGSYFDAIELFNSIMKMELRGDEK